MLFKQHKRMPIILVALTMLLLLPGLACNLGSAIESDTGFVEEPIVVDEPEVIEEPQEEPGFRPEQVLRLEFESTVDSVAFTNAGNLFATGIFTQIDLWNTSDGSLELSIDELPHSIESLAFSPDDTSLFAGFTLGGVNLYSLQDLELMVDFHGGNNNYLALSPDGSRIATGNRSGETWLWDASNGELIFTMNPADYVDGYSEWLSALAYSPDGGIVAAGHWGGQIFLWDANSGDLLRVIEPPTGNCSAWGLAFSPDGTYLVVGGHRQDFSDVINIYQVSDGSLAYVLEEYNRSGASDAPVMFSPDGTLLAAGAMDGIYIWALPNFELLHTLPIEDAGGTDWVTDLEFSPDSQHLLASYWDNYVVLWQVQE